MTSHKGFDSKAFNGLQLMKPDHPKTEPSPLNRLPTYFITHGGGPWPYMEGPFRRHFDKLETALKRIRNELGDLPKALLIVSGHWEGPSFTASASPRPSMLYDYAGFPEETYHIQYNAPGSPELAERVHSLLAEGGMPAAIDPARGLDHGTFSLMRPMYPEADIPVVQLSLRHGFDPEEHLQAGRLLAPLRDEGIVIIGSGSSYHDLQNWGPGAVEPAATFDKWLNSTLSAQDDERWARLVSWEDAPAARQAHPREDHLLPLMVAVGAAKNEPGVSVFSQSDFMGSITLSSFRFGVAADHPESGFHAADQ